MGFWLRLHATSACSLLFAFTVIFISTAHAQPVMRYDINRDGSTDAADVVTLVNGLLGVQEILTVEAASFEMGDPWSSGSSAVPVHTVWLSTYEIGRYEVTNLEYAAYLNSALAEGEIEITGEGSVYLHSGSGLFSIFDAYPVNLEGQIEYTGSPTSGEFTVRSRDGFSMAHHPATHIQWHGAAVYCNWLSRQHGYQEVYTLPANWQDNWTSDLSRNGYHLPTEAQWERAAAWDPSHMGSSSYPVPSDQPALGHWRYAFRGDTLGPLWAIYDEANPLGLTSRPFTVPTGHCSYSVSPVGCLEMSGNVAEWCHDWYDADYYSISPLTDPEGPASAEFNWRTTRGGSFGDHLSGGTLLKCSFRMPENDSMNRDTLGFRVARNP